MPLSWKAMDEDLGVFVADSVIDLDSLFAARRVLDNPVGWVRSSRNYRTLVGDEVAYSDRLYEPEHSSQRVTDLVSFTRGREMLGGLEAIAGHPIEPVGRTEVHGLETGDKVEWHSDQGMRRRFALVLHLSDWREEWGGILHIRKPGRTVGIVPQANRAVLLDLTKDSEHCVSTITGPEKRLALTGWYRSP